METRLTKYQDVEDAVIIDQPEEKKAFILGNTRGIELQNLQDDYLVPVFSRDNVETISHNDFINTVFDAAQTFYQGQQFLEPNIRVSHEMKLRTRKGSGKLVENLTDEMIKSYIENYKPLDKAGSYGIQEMPKGYIKSVEGDFENIIGISSKSFQKLLKSFE